MLHKHTQINGCAICYTFYNVRWSTTWNVCNVCIWGTMNIFLTVPCILFGTQNAARWYFVVAFLKVTNCSSNNSVSSYIFLSFHYILALAITKGQETIFLLCTLHKLVKQRTVVLSKCKKNSHTATSRYLCFLKHVQ